MKITASATTKKRKFKLMKGFAPPPKKKNIFKVKFSRDFDYSPTIPSGQCMDDAFEAAV